MKTPRTTTSKPAATTTRTDRDTTMKTSRTEMTIEMVRQLKGDELLQAHELVLGTTAKPKTPVPVLRARIVAALEKRAAEAAEPEAITTSEITPDAEPAVEVPSTIETAPVAPQDAPADAPATTAADATADATSGQGGADDAPVADTGAVAPAPVTPERALPPLGTVIEKRDRHGNVRASCTVVEGGLEYAGTIYTSISAAAMAAAKNLGLNAKRLNGWAWFGLDDQPRPVRASTPKAPKALDLDPLERAFTKYRERAEATMRAGGTDGAERVRQMLLAHAEAIFALAAPPAPTTAAEPSPAAAEAA